MKNKKYLKNKRLLINQINENINQQKEKKIDNEEIGLEWEDVTYKELDGKIGPKEPVYCFCNYISYGNMIKCDNPNCKKEWFHFHCVGLKNQPKGKWFCSEKCAKEYFKKIGVLNQKQNKGKIKTKNKKK